MAFETNKQTAIYKEQGGNALRFRGTDALFGVPECLLWGNAPWLQCLADPSLGFLFFDDFMQAASTTVSDYNVYTTAGDGATGTNAIPDEVGGIFNLVTAAADNDYHELTHLTEAWKFAEGKKLWFEARFKLTEATTNDSAWWFGFSDTLTTGGFQANAAGPLASYDGALIWKDEDSLSINFETSNAGTQNTSSDIATFVSGNWTRVGFYFDGTATTSTITPYYSVDGSSPLVAGTAQNITLSGLEEMHLICGVKAGPGGAAETLKIDYLRALQLR